MFTNWPFLSWTHTSVVSCITIHDFSHWVLQCDKLQVFSHIAHLHYYSELKYQFLSVILAYFYSLIGPHTLLNLHSHSTRHKLDQTQHKTQVGPDKNNDNTSLEYVWQHGLFYMFIFLMLSLSNILHVTAEIVWK